MITVHLLKLWNMILPFLGFNGWCLEGLLLYVLVNIQIVGFERPSFIFFFFLMWCIWRKRNMQSFEGYEQTILYMKQQHIRTLFEWMTMTGFFFLSFLSLLDFIDYHNFSTYLDLFLFLFLLFLFWLIIGFWDLNCIAPIVHSVYLGLLFWLK